VVGLTIASDYEIYDQTVTNVRIESTNNNH
jgi:hypothetical protein